MKLLMFWIFKKQFRIVQSNTVLCVCLVMSSDFATPWTISWQPCSSVHGIFQAGTLEWVAIPFSREVFLTQGRISISCIAGGFFITEPLVKPNTMLYLPLKTRYEHVLLIVKLCYAHWQTLNFVSVSRLLFALEQLVNLIVPHFFMTVILESWGLHNTL